MSCLCLQIPLEQAISALLLPVGKLQYKDTNQMTAENERFCLQFPARKQNKEAKQLGGFSRECSYLPFIFHPKESSVLWNHLLDEAKQTSRPTLSCRGEVL